MCNIVKHRLHVCLGGAAESPGPGWAGGPLAGAVNLARVAPGLEQRQRRGLCIIAPCYFVL